MPETRRRVLVVDDHLEMAKSVADGLLDRGYEAVPVASGSTARDRLTTEPFDALVTDLRMPSVDGLELLSISRKLDPDRPVIVMTAYSAVDSAVESLRRGAYHYLTKPFKQEELALFLERAFEDIKLKREASALRSELRTRYSSSMIVGHSRAIGALRDRIQRLADASAPVVVMGETGTGKGLVARALHVDSSRAPGPFVSVNCAALPEQLLESELFGHVKGAFTGATSDRSGLFVGADGGTLLLDEIAEMAPALQAKLLHVLESGTVRPVGATKPRPIDVRIIAATHQDLNRVVREGAFREDLRYRLDVVSVVVPPLRERREDIPELLAFFLSEVRRRYPSSPVRGFSREALATLCAYRWPGNVRELAHLVERVALLCERPEVQDEDLPEEIRRADGPAIVEFRGDILPIRELERRYAGWAIGQTGGHRGKAAEKLGIDPKTLRKWLGEPEGPSTQE
jgi:two-component system response regulator HydG